MLSEIENKAKAFRIALKEVPDPRDSRGKRHELDFVLCVVTLAIMSGRSNTSSIQRYINNKIDWLRQITGSAAAQVVSRAQLPRILALVDSEVVNQITSDFFDKHIEQRQEDEWVAIDGKTLRGTTHETDKQGERVVLAVNQTSRDTIAQVKMHGAKSGEVTVVRTLLQETGLEKANVTLDALHLKPKTTSQINLAGGKFIIQAKRNQKKLCNDLETVVENANIQGTVMSVDKAHGRLDERLAWCFDISEVSFAPRWQSSGFETLIVIARQRTNTKTGKITNEISYYVSNQAATTDLLQQSLFQAIRGHWGIESENWIRDVTFDEDKVKTANGNQAQVMASLRTVAIRLFRKAKMKNFQAALERFVDCPDQFVDFLYQVNFL